jgi:hypothetical protein
MEVFRRDEISIGGIGRDREIRFTHASVNSLRANKGHRLLVWSQGFERIEQSATREDIEFIHARPPHALSSK